MLQMPFFIAIVGLIYLIEVLSVMIQVTYFKKTGGKRIFKMAPIHHHFELCGWSETRVVAVIFDCYGNLMSHCTYGDIEKYRRNNIDMKNKKVLVFGSGVSGIGAGKLLEQVGASVILYDGKETLDKEVLKAQLGEHTRVEITFGRTFRGGYGDA